MITWLVGLSGAGKTTIGRELHSQWQAIAPNTVLIDGDEVRRLFRQDKLAKSYTIENRRKNAERIVELCEWLDNQSMNVVCCVLCIFDEVLHQNRNRFSNYYEVFIDTPLEVAEQRDCKGLYAKARSGELEDMVGIHIPFPIPQSPDLIIDNSKNGNSPQEQAAIILDKIQELS